MLNKQDILTKIGEAYDREQAAIYLFDTIYAILKEKWEGKALNKRIVKQIQEKIGEEAAVYYEKSYIKIWGGKFGNYDKHISFYIPSTPPIEPKYRGCWSGCINADGWAYANMCHGEAAKERQQKREKILQNPAPLDRIIELKVEEEKIKAEIEEEIDKLDVIRYIIK